MSDNRMLCKVNSEKLMFTITCQCLIRYITSLTLVFRNPEAPLLVHFIPFLKNGPLNNRGSA